MADSSYRSIVHGGLITLIALSVRWVLENYFDDRPFDSKILDLLALIVMLKCRVSQGHFCWIYPKGGLLPLPCKE